MADDLTKPYNFPFETPSEEAVKFNDGALADPPPLVPSYYDKRCTAPTTP